MMILVLATIGALPSLERPLFVIKSSLTGPVVASLACIGIAAVGLTWTFRHELEQLFSHISSRVIAIGLAAGATVVAGTLFGVTGAVI